MKLPQKRKNSAEDEASPQGKQVCLEASRKLSEAAEKGNTKRVREMLDIEGHAGCNLSKYSKQLALETILRHEGKGNIERLLHNHSDKAENLMLGDKRQNDYLNIVRALIKAGAPVHEKNAQGKSVLILAAQFRCSPAVISYLVHECSVDPNFKDESGKTALMHSVGLGDYKTALVLIEGNQCKYDIEDNSGETVFDMAKRNGSIDLLRILKSSQESGMPPMILAVHEQNNEVAKELIKLNSKFVQQHTEDGHTPLTVALGGIEKGDRWKLNRDLITTLILAGADVNTAHPYSQYTPLMFMASTGAVSLTKLLLKYGAAVDMKGPQHRTALMMAARKRDCGNLQVLLEAGANACTRDIKDRVALHYALAGGCLNCVLKLLGYYSHLEPHRLREVIGEKPLQFLLAMKDKWFHNILEEQLLALFDIAIKLQFYPILSEMLEEGLDIDLDAFIGNYPPLHYVLKNEKLVSLLLSHGADVNSAISGNTPLLRAAKKGYVDVVKVLLEYNANMNAEDLNGYTAMCIACKLNNFDIVNLLLHAGVNVNHIASKDISALLCALAEGNISLAQCLIEHGADVNAVFSNGVTVLMKAIVQDCPVNIIEFLVESKADIHAQDSCNETPLMYALGNRNRADVVSLLLKKGANVNIITSLYGRTPLMLAAKFPNNNIIQALMSYGAAASVNAQNILGNTALHVAAKRSHIDNNVLKVLIDNGADMNLFNSMDETPLTIAMMGFNVKCVRFLVENGSDVLFQDSEENRQKWIKHLNMMFKRCRCLHIDSKFFWKHVKCIEAVLDRGCSLVEVQLSNLRRFFAMCIAVNAQRVIVLLLRSGLGPYVLSVATEKTVIPRGVPTRFTSHYCNSTMCIAVRCCRKEIVTIFANYCFYDEEDLHMMQHHSIKRLVNGHFFRKENNNCPPLSVTPKTWSLSTWSTIAINKTIGFSQARESRINQLPIPQALKNKLLCRDIKLPERFSSKHFKHGPNDPPVRFANVRLSALQ